MSNEHADNKIRNTGHTVLSAPGTGRIEIRYTGNYAADFMSRSFCPDLVTIQLPDLQDAWAKLILDLRTWGVKCQPNPYDTGFAAWELEDMLQAIASLRDAMPDVQAEIDARFPADRRA